MILFLAIPHNMFVTGQATQAKYFQLVCLKFRFAIHFFVQHGYFFQRRLDAKISFLVSIASCEIQMLFSKPGDSSFLNLCAKMRFCWNVKDLSIPVLCHRLSACVRLKPSPRQSLSKNGTLCLCYNAEMQWLRSKEQRSIRNCINQAVRSLRRCSLC